MLRLLSITAAALLAGGAPALAHLNPVEHGSWAAGLSHPLLGADHVLAMVAVGLWATTIGGRALYAVPAAFVCAMILGYAAAVGGLQLPLVEPAILASVVGLGLLVALAVRVPAAVAAAAVAVFAVFHGAAHGAELGSAGALSFGIGFAAATVLLHAVGGILGLGITRIGRPSVLRILGGASALAGLGLIAG